MAALPNLARATGHGAGRRELALAHTHTREHIDVVYALEQHYLPRALGTLNHFLRDHYAGEVGDIDPRLFDLLHRVRGMLGSQRPFEVISAYRAPATNHHLRHSRGGGVALADLRDAAPSLRAGGVGFYPREQFVHIDTGRPRSW